MSSLDGPYLHNSIRVDTSGFRYSREAELLATSNTSEESARGEEK